MKTASVRGGRMCSQNYGTYFQCTFGNFDNFLLRSGILSKSHAALLLSHVSKSKINNQKEWNGYALLAVLTIGQMLAVRLARKVFSVSLCRQLLISFTEVMRVLIFQNAHATRMNVHPISIDQRRRVYLRYDLEII